MAVPIAAEVNARLQKRENTHPGLLLDKYVESWTGGVGDFSGSVQKPTVAKVAEMSAAPPAGVAWDGLFARHVAFLAAANATSWEMDTDGPLAPHLSRASALENAGLCLHRVYGFAYLPGTGLKGMTRSYAETVAKVDPNLIRQVFGHLKEPGDDTGRSGSVVFHDAWPAKWPKLTVDLLNSHHGKYYQGQRDEAPGDWDEPNMVSFLAVAPGQRFRFAVAPRRADVNPDFVKLARQWLTAALIEEGAGAKTAAGYGGFKTVGEPMPEARESPNRRRHRATLELVSPAFFAGADQTDYSTCDLRPATLRGMLRWWWRTMHSGFVDAPALRAMEATVWGSTGSGGPVRATVSPIGKPVPLPFDRQQLIRANSLPASPDNKTTQGLIYASYGMDEKKGRRAYLAPGAKWTVNLIARPGRYGKKPDTGKPDKRPVITPELLLEQAKSALWLLCQLGGVGSKSRNGFGSFADLPGYTLDQVKVQAKAFRQACGVDRPFNKQLAKSLSLEETISPLEVTTTWRNEWFAVDQVGAAMQGFAQTLAHNPRKLALGLPRKIDGPLPYPLGHQDPNGHRPPRELSVNVGKGRRHAAPVFYHLTRKSPADPFTVRVTAMVARHLPNETESRAILTDLMTYLRADLAHRAQSGGSSSSSRSTAPGLVRPVTTVGLPQTNQRVEAVLLAEKTKKGGWKAKWSGTVELVGPIVNTADVPADKNPDDGVTLLVASVNTITREITFRWPK